MTVVQHAKATAAVAHATSPPAVAHASHLRAGLYCGVLLLFCAICVAVQWYSCRLRRRNDDESMPLLARAESPREECETDGVAAIGTPARDFVRLSALPPSIFRHEEDQRRCLACGEAGKCVALRPCGHIVLCRACSDYVYTCPHCGQYISGVGLRSLPEPGVQTGRCQEQLQFTSDGNRPHY